MEVGQTGQQVTPWCLFASTGFHQIMRCAPKGGFDQGRGNERQDLEPDSRSNSPQVEKFEGFPLAGGMSRGCMRARMLARLPTYRPTCVYI